MTDPIINMVCHYLIMNQAAVRASRLVTRLNSIFRDFGPGKAEEKFALLLLLQNCELFSPPSLKAYGSILLFLEAYPDSKKLYELAVGENLRLKQLVARSIGTFGAKAIKALRNSGLPGTETEVSLGLEAITWLAKMCHGNVRLDTTQLARISDIDEQFRDMVFSPISDGILDPGCSNKELFKMASGSKSGQSPEWLLSLFQTQGKPNQFAEHCFEKLDLWATVKIGQDDISITGARFPTANIAYHQQGLLKSADVKSFCARKLPTEAKLSNNQKSKLLKAARTVLYLQGRETDSATYASAHDLALLHLEHGVDVQLIGTIPARRRFLESFIGFVMAKNGLPCAYGGAWITGRKADIGVNIFEWLRGGESALLFAQLLRVYHQRFGVNVFEVEPYQFGADNSEAIASGAFWFYWKLGFRSVDHKLNELAAGELKKRKLKRAYKTSANTLRKLAQDKLRLTLDARHTWTVSVQAIGKRATKVTGQKYRGDLIRARYEGRSCLRKSLGIKSFKGWPRDEIESFTRLSTVFSLIPAIDGWSKKDKVLLTKVMRAKGSASEKKYLELLLAHRKLQRSLTALES